jgi:hypothetical protein
MTRMRRQVWALTGDDANAPVKCIADAWRDPISDGVNALSLRVVTGRI